MSVALPRRVVPQAPRVRSVLPGVRLTLGFTIAYLLFLVIVPLSTLFVRTARLGWSGFFDAATTSRALAKTAANRTTASPVDPPSIRSS